MVGFDIDPVWSEVISLSQILPIIAALLVALSFKYARSNNNAPEGLLYYVAAFALEATFHIIYNFTDPTTTHFNLMLSFGLASRLIGSFCLIIGALKVLNIDVVKRFAAIIILPASVLLSSIFSWYIIYKIGSEIFFFRAIFLTSSVAYIIAGFAIRYKNAKHSAKGASRSGFILILMGVYGLALFTPAWQIIYSMWFVPVVLELLLVNTVTMMVTDWVYMRVQMLEKIANENKERLSLIIQSSPFPIIISRFKDDKIMLINRKAGDLFNVDPEEREKYRTVDFFVDPSERTRLVNLVRQYPVVEDFEVLVQQPGSDNSFWLLLSARVIDFDYEIALYCAFQDITDRKEKEIELFDQATRDPLTKVFNRRQFEILSDNEFSRARRYGTQLCLFMIDADHFKNVNDTFGHNIGDLVLKALADCCRETLRTSDIIARFGGEEFVILLPEVQLEKAWHIADRLRMNISNIRVPNGQGGEVQFTVSIGLVESAPGVDDPDVLIKLSDDALYQAKETGRNKVVYIPRSQYSTAVASNEYKLPPELVYTGSIEIPDLTRKKTEEEITSDAKVEVAKKENVANPAAVQKQKPTSQPHPQSGAQSQSQSQPQPQPKSADASKDAPTEKPIEMQVDEKNAALKQQNHPTVPVSSVAPPKVPQKTPPAKPSAVAPPKAATKSSVSGSNSVQRSLSTQQSMPPKDRVPSQQLSKPATQPQTRVGVQASVKAAQTVSKEANSTASAVPPRPKSAPTPPKAPAASTDAKAPPKSVPPKE
jgi:diguanylate cyclase (GGDEF)-like protein